MVFFVCEGCNETVKKNQVDKHVAKCRNCYAVTCVDCQTSFYGDDYAAHTSCISEAEKYEKSLFKGPKAKVNPQDTWMSLVMDAISDCSKADPSIQPHLKRLGDLTNIPRNQKKFGNFVKNSLRLFNDQLIEKIWKYLEAYKPKLDTAPTGKPASSEADSLQVSKTKRDLDESSSAVDGDDGEGEVSKEKKAKKDKKDKKKKRLEVQPEPEPEAESAEDEDEEAARKARKRAKKEAKRRRLEEADQA